MSKPMDDVQEIRRLLDERGVDYDEYSRNSSHVFEIDYCDACGDYLSEIEIFGACIYATKKYLTPEQAIAATLGGGYVSQDRFDELAEAYDKMADQSARLAEELNATLGGGECEMVTSGTPCEGNTDKACTSCGAYNIGEYYDGQGHIAAPKFCPECGKAVKR